MLPQLRPPLPPFTLETASQKARLAEDTWNSRDPARVALAYTATSQWRNRDTFLSGREAIVAFLTRKWQVEHEYRLVKEVWGFHEHRLAVRFQYEYRTEAEHWFRAYGNEQWEFDAQGLMQRREASINEVPITEAERKFRWPLGLPTTPAWPTRAAKRRRAGTKPDEEVPRRALCAYCLLSIKPTSLAHVSPSTS